MKHALEKPRPARAKTLAGHGFLALAALTAVAADSPRSLRSGRRATCRVDGNDGRPRGPRAAPRGRSGGLRGRARRALPRREPVDHVAPGRTAGAPGRVSRRHRARDGCRAPDGARRRVRVGRADRRGVRSDRPPPRSGLGPARRGRMSPPPRSFRPLSRRPARTASAWTPAREPRRASTRGPGSTREDGARGTPSIAPPRGCGTPASPTRSSTWGARSWLAAGRAAARDGRSRSPTPRSATGR